MHPAFSSDALLFSTREQLTERRDDLAPLVAEYERILRVCQAFGDVPDVTDGSTDGRPLPRQHAELVRGLHEVRARLHQCASDLEPLVHEYDQMLHVLDAFESAESLPAALGPDRSRNRRRRPGTRAADVRAADHQARLETLRGLLVEPRTRADLAEAMGVSQSRVTELLEPLASNGEVTEMRDAARPTRKLWQLVPDDEKRGDQGRAARPKPSHRA
jgi:hypothetical protein